MSNISVKVYKNAYETCLNLGRYLAEIARNVHPDKKINLAISGGTTPKVLFSLMKTILWEAPWKNFNVFFTDERIVPIESTNSNYGEFYRISGMDEGMMQFDTYPYITPDNAQIIKELEQREKDNMENDMINKIKKNVEFVNNLPKFDIVILGIGKDGHTASIFGNNLKSFTTNKIVECVVNPNDDSNRITLSGSVINNADSVIFLCTGTDKSNVVKDVFFHDNLNLPASRVAPQKSITWYLDCDSFEDLKESGSKIDNLVINV